MFRRFISCLGYGRLLPLPLPKSPEPAHGGQRQLRPHGDQRPQPDGEADLPLRLGLCRVKINAKVDDTLDEWFGMEYVQVEEVK